MEWQADEVTHTSECPAPTSIPMKARVRSSFSNVANEAMDTVNLRHVSGNAW
jgi:hypothetical protein